MRRRLLLVLPAALALAGCGSSDITAPTVSLYGTYTLRSINGTSLPYVTQSGAQLVADQLTINADGSYTDVSQYASGSQGGYASQTESGTYTNNNGAITFYDQTDNITYQGSLSGSVLTEVVAGLTEAFQKN